MSYVLTSFTPTGAAAVTLPSSKRGALYIGSDDAQLAYVALPGGGIYDAHGTSWKRSNARQITYKCAVTAATWAAVQTALDALKAMEGQEGSLLATMPDASTRRRLCRCTSVRGTRRGANLPYWVEDVQMEFAPKDDGWEASSATTVSTTLSTTPKNITCANGNRPVRSAVITVTVPPTYNSLTSFTIANSVSLCYLVWAGTLVAGTSLVINTGKWTVLNNAVSAGAELTLHGSHANDDWLVLEPTTNTVTLSYVGGDNVATFHIVYRYGYQ